MSGTLSRTRPAPASAAGVAHAAGRALSGVRVAPPLALALTLGVAGFLLLPDDLLYAGSTSLVAGLIGLGLFLPMAALRELPLNAAGMTGLAAYVFAYYGSHGGVGSHLLGFAVAIGSVVAMSLIGGLASLVVTGLYFVVASLVIQVGIEKVIFPIPVLTGGAAGRSVWQPHLQGWFNTQRCIYLIVAVAVLVCAGATARLLRSRLGFHAVLVGHVPEGASATGLRNWVVRLMVFALSGVLIGIAGCLDAFTNGTPPPPVLFGVVYSVIYVAIPIASGMRDLASVWLVAAAFTCIPIALESQAIQPNLLSGVILLTALGLAMYREADVGLGRRLRARLRPDASAAGDAETAEVQLIGRRAQLTVVSTDLPRRGERAPALTLEGRDLGVVFGGVVAAADVSLRVGPGERVAIVGANGAGKTTVFNALTGFVPLHSGRVLLGDEDVTGWPPLARARAGVRRTFQQPRLADVLTVGQNVICGHGSNDAVRSGRVEWLLDHFGLAALRDMPVSALPFGVRRQVELVRALAETPQVLMLDEPVSGLEDEEAETLVELLLELQAKEGWGLLVIEHALEFVTAVAEQLIVMEDGRVLVQGPLHEVMREEQVRRVYLGETVTV